MIFPDEFNENVTEAVYDDDNDDDVDNNDALHVAYDVFNNTVVDDNITITDGEI